MSIDISSWPQCIKNKIVALSQDNTFTKSIHKGANGYVLIGRNNVLCRDIVIKFYYWGGGEHTEPSLLAKLESYNILTVLHAEVVDFEFAFFMPPYCGAGDLDDSISTIKYGPTEAIDIILQIASGVTYLHSNGYLHRDLKPSNIFSYENGRYVIGDFGSVVPQNADGYARTLTRHSLLYRPIEEIRDKRFYRQSDIYQLGLILFQLSGGYLPYEEESWLDSKQKIKYRSLEAPESQFYASDIIEDKIKSGALIDFTTIPPWIPKSLINIIKKCCNPNFSKRFSSTSDLCVKLNNIRSGMSDWKVNGHPTLFKNKKYFRIVEYAGAFNIEKN